MQPTTLTVATEIERRRYDRIAPIYDVIETVMELRARLWRRELWARVTGKRVLELGIGTGKNIPFHPRDAEIVGLDLSPRMLAVAQVRADKFGSAARLTLGDVQQLNFPDSSFDEVVATFLFCSVPNPLLGLREALRVLKPGGRLRLLEHVLSQKRLLRTLMNVIDPIPFHLLDAHINRETVETVVAAGFADVIATNLSLDIVKRIEARKARV